MTADIAVKHGPSPVARTIVGALVLGFLIGVAPLAAHAGQAVSSWGYYTINGVAYKNAATISTSSGSAVAWTAVAKNGSGCFPSGWAGARARIFNSAGSMLKQSSILYNSGCTVMYDQGTSVSGSGARYSYGVTWGWTGSQYSAVYTYKSPNQSS